VGITQLSISIMHAHLKKKCLMLMPNELMTKIVNAHAQVYVQWASSFSISIMHAHLKKKEKVLCLCPAGFNFSKIHLCPGLPGFTYGFFGSYPARRVFLKVDTRPAIVETPNFFDFQVAVCQGAPPV
jgi:hypothetical protein